MKASELVLSNFRYLCWQSVASNTAARSGYGYLVDATGAPVTITLPPNPHVNDLVAVCDAKAQAQVSAIVIDRGVNKIEGQNINKSLQHNRDCLVFMYSGTTDGWLQVSHYITGIGQDFEVKTDPDGNDYVLILDSADGNSNKRVLVSKIVDGGSFI